MKVNSGKWYLYFRVLKTKNTRNIRKKLMDLPGYCIVFEQKSKILMKNRKSKTLRCWVTITLITYYIFV